MTPLPLTPEFRRDADSFATPRRGSPRANGESALTSPAVLSEDGVAGFGRAATVAKLPGGARVSADDATNSLIVYAPADVQTMYAQLIESLDQRRPQVLIQAQVIAVSTTDNYSLGD